MVARLITIYSFLFLHELQPVLEGAALLLRERRGLGAIVLEDGEPRAFGMTTFADEALIDAYLAEAHPHLGRRLLLDALNPHSSSILQLHQIGERNAGRGLQVVVVNCNMHPATRDPGAVLGAVIAANFHVHRGYRIARYLNEVYGEMNVSIIESSRSYEIRRIFELPVGDGTIRSLVGTVTREQATAWSNPLLALFAYSPPRLRFTPPEQRLLSEALAGVTDETLSARLGVPVSAIKGRWSRIQERVMRLAPELFPNVPEAPRRGRGVQTRHLILQYLREHPSELTPYAWPDTRIRQRHIQEPGATIARDRR